MPKIVFKTGRALAAIASETYGTTLPSTCMPGDTFLKTDATAGQMMYYCYATDTWQQSTGGGGAVSSVFGRTGAVVAVANDYAWGDIASKPSTFPPSTHSHPESEVTNLVTDLAGKAASSHTHAEADVTNLVTDLGNKSAVGHTHAIGDTTNLQTTLDGKAASSHVHAISDTTGLQTALDGKQALLGFTAENAANKDAASGYAGLSAGSKIAIAQIPTGQTGTTIPFGDDTRFSDARTPLSHSHAESDITGLVTDLAGKQATLGFTPENSANKGAVNGYAGLDTGTKIPIAQIPTGSTASTVAIGNDARLSDARTPLSHTHPESDVTNLTTDLAAKQATSAKGTANGYAGLDAGTKVPTAQLGSGTASTSTFLRGDQSWAAPGGGSDPWTYVVLASDFITSSATAVDVTGMALTPTANLRYEISGIFLLRTATTTVGPRTGVAWPTGMTDGVVTLTVESAAGTQVMAQGNVNAAVLAPVGGLPTNTQSYPGELNAMLLAGASPSGTFKIQLASETAGTNVTMKAGSFFRWRTF